MAVSESQQRASKKYQAKLERIYVWVAPEMKQQISTHAEQNGESLTSFVQRAITETMERDSNKD